MAYQVPPSVIESWPAIDVEEVWLWLQDHPLPDHWEIGAQIACLLYNANRGKGSPKLGIEDFKPVVRKKKQTVAQARAALGG